MCCHLTSTLRSGKKIELLIYLDFFCWYLELWNSSSPPEQSWISGTFQNSLLLFLLSSKLVEFPNAAFMPPEKRSTGHFIFKGPSLVLTGTSSVLLARSALLFLLLEESFPTQNWWISSVISICFVFHISSKRFYTPVLGHSCPFWNQHWTGW